MSNLKVSEEKHGEGNIFASEIYDIIKSKSFLNELHSSVIADLKNKPVFKKVREKIEKFVRQQSNILEDLSDNPPDDNQRKVVVAELCTVAYTVDTVFSRVLFTQLEKEFRAEVANIIKVLRSEGKIPDAFWSKFQPHVSKSKDIPKSPTKEHKGNSSKSTPVKIARNNHSDVTGIENFTKLMTRKVDDRSMETKNKKSDSDVNIEILSDDSVSSVHTSDLSSFDSDISISDDENGEKKKIPFQVCKELIEQKLKSKGESEGEKVLSPLKAAEAAGTSDKTVLEPTPNGISKRIRKPNSRYSEHIVMSSPVKERKTEPGTLTKGKNTPNDIPAKRKRSSNSVFLSDNEKQMPAKVGRMNNLVKETISSIGEQKKTVRTEKERQNEGQTQNKVEKIDITEKKKNSALENENPQEKETKSDMNVDTPIKAENMQKETVSSVEMKATTKEENKKPEEKDEANDKTSKVRKSLPAVRSVSSRKPIPVILFSSST